MSRQAKWWEHEQAVETRIGNVLIKQFPKSGVLQIHNWIESDNYTGPSKGVVVHLDKLTIEQGQQIADAIQGAVEGEQDFRPKEPKLKLGKSHPLAGTTTRNAKRRLATV